MVLRIRQYAYFALLSDRVSPGEITARLGCPPDVARRRGERVAEPAVPVRNMWIVEERGAGGGVTEQIAAVVGRLAPYAQEIAAVARDLEQADPDGSGAVLRVVRYLDDEDGVEDGFQHRLLGWHLDRRTLQFLVDVNAHLDADEYGASYPWWRPRAARRYRNEIPGLQKL